jgi:hypothetical protein
MVQQLHVPATLGGTTLLPYVALCVGAAKPTTAPAPLTPSKSLPWIAAGIVALLLYAFVLGPGVPR